MCLQKDPIFQTYRGDEDCLYLNVYTPKVGTLLHRQLKLSSSINPLLKFLTIKFEN
jgi:hypothetical protein